MKKIYVENKNILDELYNDSALTMEGLAEDSIPDFIDWIKERTELENERAYIITGKIMNEKYMLTGDNSYSDDLTIVCIKLSDMKNPNNIFTARFEIGGRWFDDVVDNNIDRENQH